MYYYFFLVVGSSFEATHLVYFLISSSMIQKNVNLLRQKVGSILCMTRQQQEQKETTDTSQNVA